MQNYYIPRDPSFLTVVTCAPFKIAAGSERSSRIECATREGRDGPRRGSVEMKLKSKFRMKYKTKTKACKRRGVFLTKKRRKKLAKIKKRLQAR